MSTEKNEKLFYKYYVKCTCIQLTFSYKIVKAVWHYERNDKYHPFSKSNNDRVETDWLKNKDCSQFTNGNTLYIIDFKTMAETIQRDKQRTSMTCFVDRLVPEAIRT